MTVAEHNRATPRTAVSPGGVDPAPAGRVAGLDALRGVAIALVMLTHADGSVFGSGGMVGVTLFFVLSGFLITGLLVRDLEADGRVRWGRFYGARALRLLPPLALVLVGYLVVEGVLGLFAGPSQVPWTLFSALTYTSNLPYLPHGSGAFFHLWTLATEEQFYLLWPLVLAVAWRRRWVRRAVALGIAGSLLLCAATIAYQAPDVARVYALPTSWSVALFTGCALRLGRDRASRALPAGTAVRRLLAGGLLAAFAALAVAPGLDASPWMYLAVVPAIAVASAVLVLLAAESRWRARGPVRAVVALGTVSYAAYLWNLPITQWLGDPRDLAGGALGIALTLAAATASWWLVERPAARLRRRWQDGAGPGVVLRPRVPRSRVPRPRPTAE
ncbi:acyltransferase [Cellulomonas sp. Y8]|uniref:acyltransferase family protein n=1 Tax=Cellulomonas sp. Y8 TaxID=2591145 RepID=UPI0011CBEE72|nr:acyltransferase [Cellulomonas sp. Y8]